MHERSSKTLQEDMSSKQRVVPPAQTTIKCAGCDSEFDINWFCKNCSASLCDACKTRHETDRFLGIHKVVPRTGSVIRARDSSKVNERCSGHPDKEITVYCNDCGDPCCSTCLTEKHRRHDVIAIEMKYMECEDKLNDAVKDIKNNAIGQLKSSITDLKEKLNFSEKKFEEVKSEVNQFRQELKDTVDKSCDKLINELEEKQAEQKSEMSRLVKRFEEQITDYEHFMSLCAEKISRGGRELTEFSKLPVPSSTQTVSDISQLTPRFVPGGTLLQTIMKNLGEIRWEGNGTITGTNISTSSRTSSTPSKGKDIIKVVPSDTDVRDDDKNQKDKGKPAVMKSITDAKVISTFETEIIGSSVVPAGKGTAWISYQNNETMYMYDDRGKKLRSVTVTKGAWIWDIAVKRSGDVIVCNDDKKVRLVTVNGKVNALINTAPFFSQGVCLTEKEEIVVCMIGQCDRNHVAVYSPDGKRKVRNIIVKDDKGEQLLTDPYRVVMNGEDISVLNYRSNVMTSGQVGKVRWVYDGSQTKYGKLNAAGMCIDKFCNLLISDYYNSRVHYVDREGVLIQILLTRDQHGVEYPWGIGVDNGTGNVWLGSISTHLKIFRYLQN